MKGFADNSDLACPVVVKDPLAVVGVRSEEKPADVREVYKGRIFNIQRFSIEDGPGIRTVVFLKGCPLRCPWCSNPESLNSFLEIGHIDTLCDHCGRCLEVCEPKAIRYAEKGIHIDRGKCTNCGACVPVCAANAMRLFGQDLSLEELLEELEKDSLYYRNSGGGITVSGGEVLVRPKFTAAILKECQEMGYHTAIETSGYGSKKALDTVLEHLDLALYDLKIMDPARHLEVIGVPNAVILRNAKRVLEKGVPMIIRVPVIPGQTDTEENIRDIARFVKEELDPGLSVNLLPYHRFGQNKYKMLDREYQLSELPPPDGRLGEIVDFFEASGLTCEIIR